MLPSWKIGRLFGINLFLHWTFWLLPAWVALLGVHAGATEVLLNLTVLAAAFGCIVLHELGHALTARRFGIGTRDITLYPIGGVASLERMPERPLHEFWIAIAGPAVNVVIAIFLALLLSVVALVAPGMVLGSLAGLFLVRLLLVNVAMVLFNLLPAFPMDGGRVLRSLLTMAIGPLRATRAAVRVGIGMALLLGIGGALWLGNPFLMVIALFVYVAGQQELQYAEYRERQRRLAEPFAVRSPHEVLPLFPLRPEVTVFTWDAATGRWIRQPQVRSSEVL